MAGDPIADALAIIRSIDWSRLAHAYGPAHDTPAYLVALASSTDAETPSDALSHLWGAVLHQGSLYSSTPATARVVAALLADSRTTDPVARWADLGEDPLPLRATLLDFLAAFAESCFVDSPDDLEAMAHLPGREAELAQLEAGWPDDDEEPPDEALLDALYARVTLASRAQCPHLLDAVVPLLADPLPAVRLRAANCIAKLCQHADLAAQRAALLAEIERAARAGGTEERAALVLSLGELGADTSPFLADAHPAVRCCAALVPSQTDKPAATCEILAALLDPAAADHWLPRVPQLKGWLRFTLLREAIRRTCSFEELLPTALAIARGSASVHTVESDWGPLLAAAFPAPPQGPLSPAQHAYLAALVANERLWDPRNGNAHLWFKRLGLPYDRDACRSLLRGSG